MACGESAPPPHPSTQSRVVVANSAGIDKIRTQLPKGYEIAPLPKPAVPTTFWGLPPHWTSDPARCGVLPTPDDDEIRGWSASGPGGIVYATAGPAVAPSAAMLDACPQWILTADQSVAAISHAKPPLIPDAQTLALAVGVSSRVENGAKTQSQAVTLVAYLDILAVSVTVVTDPGVSGPALPPEFATTLLAAAVRAVRS
ncbi:DUF5642 family protein [Mycobacterium sp. OTB74]|uniref:DUF5642 family protein n=1 Tax=Mycobacterium sp. OTB74 TaxID=1853452 RepID=UPI002476430B|nr:DUF5642 family protein [Mycobacterium sp. OTB74]